MVNGSVTGDQDWLTTSLTICCDYITTPSLINSLTLLLRLNQIVRTE